MERSNRRSIWGRLKVLAVGSMLAVGTIVLSADAQAQQQPLQPDAGMFKSVTSGIQIQNIGPAPANATIAYYNPDGSLATTQVVPPIPVSGSFTAFGSTMAAPKGFSGSAVVSADQPVNAIVNLLTAGLPTGEAYDGVGAPGLTEYVPLFQQGNHGYVSTLNIQNTSTTSANTVTVTFQGAGAPAPVNFALGPNASVAVDGSNDQITVPTFVGSVIVTGTQPVAVEVNQTNNAILFANTGSASGATTIYAPLLMTNNHGFSTGFQVQNTGGSATTLSLFLNGSSTAAATANVGAGQSVTWYPIPTTSLTGPTFIGSGTVTSSPAMPLLGAVNELNTAGQGMTYNAFGSGTQSVQMPLVMFNNHGYYTGEQIQNVGTAASTVDFLINGNVVGTQTIQPGASFTWFSFTNGTIYGNQPVSSAIARGRSSTDTLVGIVNEITNPQIAGDSSFAYEGFNQ